MTKAGGSLMRSEESEGRNVGKVEVEVEVVIPFPLDEAPVPDSLVSATEPCVKTP